METDCCCSPPCSGRNFVEELKEKKEKEEQLKATFAKKFEECGKDLRHLTFLNSTITNLDDIVNTERKILALIEKQKTENPIDKSFDQYKNYDLAVERLWKYFNDQDDTLNTDAVKDMVNLQGKVNADLEDLIAKMEKCTAQ